VSDLVTDLFTSLMSVIILCNDTLLSNDALRKINFDDNSWSFVKRHYRTHSDDEPLPSNVGEYVRFIRNAVAHGNVNLEPGAELIGSGGDGITFQRPLVITVAIRTDFSAIEVWENIGRTSKRRRGTILSCGDMWSIIEELQQLSHDKTNWSHQAKQWSEKDWRWPLSDYSAFKPKGEEVDSPLVVEGDESVVNP
jgi:hypothetical protein